jgi:hypothetical protein
MRKRLGRRLTFILLLLLGTCLFLAGENRVAHAQYDVTIWSWDSVIGWLDEPIWMDGGATGFTTPHTFTGLTGTHIFSVPSTNKYGSPFTEWDTGETSISLTVTSGATYTARYYAEQVATPTFIPPAGTYSSPQIVSITCSTSDAVITYTTDGSEPSSTSPVYSGYISVDSKTTIKAKAFKTNIFNSDTSSATYTIVSSSDSIGSDVNLVFRIIIIVVIAVAGSAVLYLYFKKRKTSHI